MEPVRRGPRGRHGAVVSACAIVVLGAWVRPAAAACTGGPGTITTPATGAGVAILNPNADTCASIGPDGFVLSDVTESEVPFIAVPQAQPVEPAGDANPNTSDIVDTAQGGQSFFVLFDQRGTSDPSDDVLLFRVRIDKDPGNAAFGYSVLVDIDMVKAPG